MQFEISTARGVALALMLGGAAGGLLVERGACAAADTFDALMASSMTQMDRDMMVAPSGDPDRDFAMMMIPHHQGAIDMAKVELRYGRDKVLRRLAEGIVVEQQQEIMVMHQAIAALPPISSRGKNTQTMMPNMQHSNSKVQ